MKRNNKKSVRGKKVLIFIGILVLVLTINLISAVRLPTVNGDSGTWGNILNEFLNVSHNGTGEIKNDSIGSLQIINGTITDIDISNTTNLTLGEKITFTFGEIIDNIVNGWIRVTGGLNVTEDINVVRNVSVGGNLTVVGNVTAGYFIGSINASDVQNAPWLTTIINIFDQSLNTTDNVNFQNLILSGNLTVLGEETILNVTNLDVNGSISPALDNLFDLGSSGFRWKDISLSGNANINGTLDVNEGTLYVNVTSSRVGIGTTSPNAKLDIQASSGNGLIINNTNTGTPNSNTATIRFSGNDDEIWRVGAEGGGVLMVLLRFVRLLQ